MVPVLPPAVDELDAAGVLAHAEATLVERRLAQVEDLRCVLAWADLHSGDPQLVPGAVPARYGGNQLVDLGGDGTPRVQDLCLAELATARQTHLLSTRATMADALDLRHRLPRLWVAVQELTCEPWLACKVASMSRGLTREQVTLVDDAVTDALGCAPGRVLRITEATIIEADTDTHVERLEAARRRRGVMVTPSDEAGLRTLVARIEAGDAAWIDATIDRVADLLTTDRSIRAAHHPDLPEDASKDELRAVALGWLARPHDLATLLGLLDDTPETPQARRASAVVHVHLSHAALTIEASNGTGVARVEELGPMVLDQVRRLLRHAHITLTPVLDLAATTAVDRYEHPTPIRDRTQVLLPGDVFPHASTLTRTRDHDHPVPYDPLGPPGQTSDHNCAPLTRRHHRAKTHLGYTVDQVNRTTFVWRTPHGLLRAVDHTGTHAIDDVAAFNLTHPDWLDEALARLSARETRGGSEDRQWRRDHAQHTVDDCCCDGA